jgi:cbb3-type cytochrome oxidase subunit 3
MPVADPATFDQPLPLRDLHLPPPPGWWPPAPGWWLLVALVIVLLLLLFFLWQRARRLRYRRAALRQLHALEENDALPPSALVAELSALLRRAALCAFPDESCAGLSGEEWLRFLDRSRQEQPFSTGVGRCLATGPYQREVEIERAELLRLCRCWLQKLPPMPRRPGGR